MFSRGCTSAEKERWQEAICQIRRARWLPVAWKVKKATIARGPMAKAVTGWFWRKPTQKMVNQLQLNISNSLGEAKCSSVCLRHLLRGHDLHAQFSISSRLVGAVWRQVNKRPQSTPIGWHAKGFTTVFSQLMSQLGMEPKQTQCVASCDFGKYFFSAPPSKSLILFSII